MQLINNPNPKDWKELCQRPTASLEELMPIVRSVFEEVSRNGDTALKNYTEQFDGVSCADLALTATQIEEAINKVDESLMPEGRRIRHLMLRRDMSSSSWD